MDRNIYLVHLMKRGRIEFGFGIKDSRFQVGQVSNDVYPKQNYPDLLYVPLSTIY